MFRFETVRVATLETISEIDSDSHCHGQEYCRARGHLPPSRFLEAHLKSLIFTIGAPPPIYNLRLLCPSDFNAYWRIGV